MELMEFLIIFILSSLTLIGLVFSIKNKNRIKDLEERLCSVELDCINLKGNEGYQHKYITTLLNINVPHVEEVDPGIINRIQLDGNTIVPLYELSKEGIKALKEAGYEVTKDNEYYTIKP